MWELIRAGGPAMWPIILCSVLAVAITLERTWARPTFEVNGLLSGFTGEGAKTVLPAVSMAKVSMRLVPDQEPQKVGDLFEAYSFSDVRTNTGLGENAFDL